MTPLPRDVQFAQIVAWLQKHDLEMHTPMRGETYVRKRRPRSPRLIESIKERNEDESPAR